jgi:hypothetical protein
MDNDIILSCYHAIIDSCFYSCMIEYHEHQYRSATGSLAHAQLWLNGLGAFRRTRMARHDCYRTGQEPR